jgi:hypothetical protein
MLLNTGRRREHGRATVRLIKGKGNSIEREREEREEEGRQRKARLHWTELVGGKEVNWWLTYEFNSWGKREKDERRWACSHRPAGRRRGKRQTRRKRKVNQRAEVFRIIRENKKMYDQKEKTNREVAN